MVRPLARFYMLILIATAIALGGCRTITDQPLINPEGHQLTANPLTVPMIDRWLLMDQISDELEDYFRIYREERVRLIDSVLTEGWIETHPKIGSTILEPWHKDSTRGFERVHASLQTVRRFAKVRVIPAANSYLIDVRVYKELEDLPQPQQSTVSGRPLRHDNSLDIDDYDTLEFMQAPIIDPKDKGWIPMGRDFSLEQVILRNINARLQDIMNTAGPGACEDCQ